MRDLDPRWFRRHIGLVSQEPVLFACSIADNITYGKEDTTKEEVRVLLAFFLNVLLMLHRISDRLRRWPGRPMHKTSSPPLR